MKTITLGKTGIEVRELGLGAMYLPRVSPQESDRIIAKALELGINFLDTADVYGWTEEHGFTEEIIGRWLAQGSGRRDASWRRAG